MMRTDLSKQTAGPRSAKVSLGVALAALLQVGVAKAQPSTAETSSPVTRPAAKLPASPPAPRALPAGLKLRAGDLVGPKGSDKTSSFVRTAYVMSPKRPGFVRVSRGEETFEGQLVDARGKVNSRAFQAFSRMLRFHPTGETHTMDPRLAKLLGRVSDHFGGREIALVSGFRPFSPKQYTPHSNHNQGKAMDFAVRGVPNEVVRDFCKSFPKTGVGYYPNSSFLHLDVREVATAWTDYAGPREPPQYRQLPPVIPESDVQEGDEGHPGISRGTTAKNGALGDSLTPASREGSTLTPERGQVSGGDLTGKLRTVD